MGPAVERLFQRGGRDSNNIPRWGRRSNGYFSGEGGIRTRGRDLWSRQPLSRRPHSTTLAPPQYSLVKPAEGEGFEPTVSCPTPVFKTGALNHSAILPGTAGVAARTFYHTCYPWTRIGQPCVSSNSQFANLRIRLYQHDHAIDDRAGGIDRELKVHRRAAAQRFE